MTPGCIFSSFKDNSFQSLCCVSVPSSLLTNSETLGIRWRATSNTGMGHLLSNFAVIQILSMSLWATFSRIN